ncbi:HlyD family secretion protein [Paraglaciecola sp.]|uniref:HlyD family secretion protein n=1 Tax=Paraglaciecola sp. TaxID=1920173 RepID=UPI003EF40D8E
MIKRLLLGGVLSFLVLGCQEEKTSSTPSKVSNLTAPAELIALDNATLGPPLVNSMWQFKIQKMAAENTFVKEGDVVIEFDTQRLRNDLVGRKSKLNAEIKQGESRALNDEAKKQDLILALAEAEMNFEKAKRRVEIVDVSRSAIDKKLEEANYKYQNEKLAQAKQKLEHHKKSMLVNNQVNTGKVRNLRQRVTNMTNEIEKLKVKAPKDGLVMYLEDWNGKKPAVGETVYMGLSLIQLPSLENVALKAEFAEPDMSKLSVGQEVKVIFEAFPETSYMGEISTLGQAFYPKSPQNPKVVFEVEIQLGEARPKTMRPGMKAKIEVVPS